MDAHYLKTLRTGTGKTQTEFAELMGVPFRTYQDLEAGKSAIRQIHANSVALAMIKLAAEGRGYDDLPLELGELVKRAYLGKDAK